MVRRRRTQAKASASVLHAKPTMFFKQQKRIKSNQAPPTIPVPTAASGKGADGTASPPHPVQLATPLTDQVDSELLRLPVPENFSLARTVCSFGFLQLAPNVWLPYNWQLVTRSDLLQVTSGKGTLVPDVDLDTDTDLMRAVTDDRGMLIRPFNFGKDGSQVQWLVVTQATAVLDTPHLREVTELVVRTIAPPTSVQSFTSPAELQFTALPPLSPQDTQDLKQAVVRCLRLDDDFSAYHNLLQAQNATAHNPPHVGAVQYVDRMWRSPTVWEDLVLTQLCVNCTWSRTLALSHNLCKYVSQDGLSFPTPKDVLQYGAGQLQQVCRVGFRAERLFRLAVECGNNDLEQRLLQLCNNDAPSPVIANMIQQLYGYGPYTANTMLHLLGRFDCCASDTETVRHLKHVTKTSVTEKSCNQAYGARYDKFASYQFLVYWSELQHNYRRQAQSALHAEVMLLDEALDHA